MKVHFFGGETSASLHDVHGAMLVFSLNKSNVESVILQVNILTKLHGKYEVRNNGIRCEPCRNISVTLNPIFAEEEVRLVATLLLLDNYVTDVVEFDDTRYLVTDVDGVKWFLRKASLAGDISFGPLLSYQQEPQEYTWLMSVLHEGGTFVDVGANVGGYSLRASKMGARVIAVEPDPDNCRVLMSNFELNRCIYCNAQILRLEANKKFANFSEVVKVSLRLDILC